METIESKLLQAGDVIYQLDMHRTPIASYTVARVTPTQAICVTKYATGIEYEIKFKRDYVKESVRKMEKDPRWSNYEYCIETPAILEKVERKKILDILLKVEFYSLSLPALKAINEEIQKHIPAK